MSRTKMSWYRTLTAFALGMATVAAAGCGAASNSEPGADHAERLVIGSAAESFPEASLRDWKSYADHVVVYTVTGETEIPASQEDLQRGEGLVGRVISIRIENVVWSAPGAPKLPEPLSMRAPGWVLREGVKVPVSINGAPRTEVGERFVAPLFRRESADGSEWGPLTAGSQLRLDGGQVAAATPLERSPVRAKLAGMSTAQVREMVASAAADPRAERRRSLRPLARVKAVQAEDGPQETSAP